MIINNGKQYLETRKDNKSAIAMITVFYTLTALYFLAHFINYLLNN